MTTLKKLFIILTLLFVARMASAQDVIVKKDQSTIMSKVLEITSAEIKYKKWSNQDGPAYSIRRSEVLSINFENGEVETFLESPKHQSNNDSPQSIINHQSGFMDINMWGKRLRLDGRVLSDEEVLSLVGNEYYQLYKKGRDLGIGFYVTFYSSFAFGGVASVMIRSVIKGNEQHQAAAVVLSLLTASDFVTSLILAARSSSKLRQVAEAYNNGQTRRISFSISPSVMRCEIPQSEGNCGLGLTLSMNF